ncbi:MAG: 3-methylornithine--L-lysine ligase PylC [Firmicutes bacterium]|nr:3-methylornithine--L-lysine ligase PylC [Bacillota bacterium]
MTKVCIIGGKLQGVEALYLAGKAGMETILIDHNESPLGKNFCGRFICQDVLQYDTNIISVLEEADFVLPALENQKVLDHLKALAEEYDINLVYDPRAYGISSSKKISDEKMAEADLPCPRYYPAGNFPYIVKPSAMSGSEGVAKIHNKDEMEAFLQEHEGEEWIAQEFLDGPSYSLEVIGTPGNYQTYHVTELFMDPVYDCKRVLSCPDFPADLKKQLEDETLALAQMVDLHGIMDVEVIETNGVLKILEIDARIPSQTPITVYHATGWNMMTEMAAKFGKSKAEPSKCLEKERFVSLEQILCEGNVVSVLGEHVVSQAETLCHRFDFCGADEALTDYAPGKEKWAATLICIADSKEELEAKRSAIPEKVAALLGKNIEYHDDFPKAL